MKQNIWKILAITFFAISLTLFIWGYSHIKNAETTHLNEMKELETKTTIRIKELEMRISQDSLKINESSLGVPCPPGKDRVVRPDGTFGCN